MPEGNSFLVTGGAGFIGSHLVERLLADGHDVTVIDDFSTGSQTNLTGVANHPQLKVIQQRVSDCQELEQLTDAADFIFHLAAAVGVHLVVRSPVHTIETNLSETAVLLRTAGRHGTPVLLASTSEVYGKSTREVFSETDDLLIGPPHLGRWSYACSKLMDEFLGMAHATERHLPVIIARLFNTVGSRQTGRYGMVLPRFIEAARGGEPLGVFGDGNQVRCFCHVGDTVEALVRLQECPRASGEVFNIGGTEETTINNLARLVIEVLGSSSGIVHIDYDEAYAPGFEDMRRRKPIVDKLKQFTKFHPDTPLRRIVELTAGIF